MEDKILSYNAAVQYIPKDGNDERINVADYYTVTQRDIDATTQNYELIRPISPEAALIGSSGAGPDTSGTFIAITENLTNVTINENSSTTLTIVAELNNGEGQLEYQWEKQESGSEVWTTISGATTASYSIGPVTFANDNLDSYRCVVSFDEAINTPLISDVSVITVKRVITITQQPVIPLQGFINGLTATFNITANITSGVISYQWQKKEFGTLEFYNIAGATSTSLTTPTLNTLADNGDEYRCILSNSNADTVVSTTIRLLVSGADFEVTPAVNGISFWRLGVDGPLILDPNNSTQYTIKCLDIDRSRMITKMWGEGTCNSRGGYAEGIIPIQQNDLYRIRLNAGAGSGGDSGGGYAGIFSGTTVSQANALLIAGGAGGGGASSSGSCVYSGGTGGGTSGGDGIDASANAGGGDGGTQSAGGAGGTTTNTTTLTNTYTTAGTHTITIPANATNVSYEIIGGTGGKGGDSSGGQTAKAGGRGQRITGTLNNVAGQTLTLVVGSPGSDGSSGSDVLGGSGGSGYRTGGSGGKSGIPPSTSNITTTVTSTGTVHSLSIPSNITSISFELAGGRGGNGGSSTVLPIGEGFFTSKSGGQGAFGQKILAYPSISSVAGKTLSLYVGDNGQTATGNNGFDFGGGGGSGYNSGGKGGDQFGGETWGTAGSGGGGGGSSAVVDGSTPIIIAGGGGGGAGSAANSAGESSTTSTFLSDFANYGNGSQGGWGADTGNGASGGGGGGHGDGYLGGGIGGPDNASGNHAGGFAGRSGGAYFSSSYLSSSNITLSNTTTGGYVTVVYSVPASSTASIASGGGGGGSSAITIGGTLITEAGGGGGSGGASVSNTAGAAQSSSSLSTSNNSSNGSNGANACSGYANSGAGGGGGGNSGGSGGTSPCSGSEVSGGGGTSGGGYYNSTYVSGASVTTGTTDARIVITYTVPTSGTSGSALQGGAGGGPTTYAGGGGGGGYWGGGGGAGNSASSGSGSGGGGSGFVAPTVLSGYTSSFTNESDPDRGTAGAINGNSRFVIIPVNIVVSQQPSSTIVVEGNSVTFSVVAEIQGISGQQINYQWQKKEYLTTSWVTISGATSSSYTLNNVSSSDTSDFYRCVMTNIFCPTVVSNEADITVITQTTDIIYRTAGNANFTIPLGVDKVKFYMWGAGGSGTGEACNGPFSGGSGGYLTGTVDVNSGDVFLARVGSSDNGSQDGLEGFGAGKGGGWTGLFKYVNDTPTLFAMVGGGGGAGQAGNGGGGGAPGSNGGNGTGPNAGSGATSTAAGSGGTFYSTGSSFNSGGPSGGSGINQGNRGGGGGGGYYGGGGGTGTDSGNCSGGGGGGGSGFIDINYLDPNDNSYTSSAGNTGSSSGADPSVKGTLWQDFVNSTGGYQAGRSGNNGLIIFELTYSYDFQISPAVAGKEYWSLLLDGPLVLDAGNSTSYSITPLRNLSRNIKMWGQGSTSGSGTGGYSEGSVVFDTTKTYEVRLNAGAGDRGAGGYAGIFMTSVSQGNAIMIAGGAGGKGNNGSGIGGGFGGLAGGGGGSSGTNGTGGDNGISQPGSGGTQSSGGAGGAAPQGNLGTRPYGGTGTALQGGNGGAPSSSFQDALPFGSGQWYYYGNVWGGGGGGGYFGGGGGGGGGGTTYGGPETEQYSSSGGGGGSGYINTTYVVNGSTGTFSNSSDPNRGNAGTAGYNSRIVITS